MLELLFIIWTVIDVVLFLLILPSLRRHATKYTNEPRKRSIESEKNLWEKVLDILSEMCLFFPLLLLVYIVVYFIPDIGIQIFLEWYKGLFFVALFPVILGWIVEKSLKVDSFWECSLIVLAVLFSIVGYVIDAESMESITQYRVILDLFLTIFLTVFLETLLKVRKVSNRYNLKKLSNTGIRVDLYNRTPGLVVNISNIELIKYCEKYFDKYMCRYRKIRKICTVEYVNLMGVHRELWYAKMARFIKVFVGISSFMVVSNMLLGNSLRTLGVIGLIVIFGVLIKKYKHIDIDYLYKIAIRYAYDEWGYYLSWENGDKYVGTAQMLDLSKYHKYVHSFLDIVALCRAVAFNDKMNEECKISIISRNLSELFINYTDYEEEKNWEMFLPLWQAALFEFNVTGRISAEVKTVLNMVSDKSVRFDISIFLQSFWADIERKKIEDGILDFVQLFENELFA